MSQETENEDLGYHPDILDADPEEEKVYCFLSQERVCGPDCTAYMTFIKTNNKHVSGPAKNCIVLTSVERVGRHLPIIASVLDGRSKQARTEAADRQREAGAPKVDPRPGPFASNPFPTGGSNS